VFAQTKAIVDVKQADETELRQLATNFYHTLEAGNQSSFSELWSAQSPNNELQSFARQFLLWRIHRFEILSISTDGDSARVNVHAEIEPLSQPQWPKISTFMGWRDLQTLRCLRDGTTWKVLEQLNTFEDFLRDLVDAPKARRLQLLSEHPDLISNDLMIALYPSQI